ncbi:FtsW/RodA/SpoVE family cell cycle protein [Candidatus Saccharibacteria bacterium]|nr:FtsW/RodA/SpoVE family cell cycle protein [Candidatus Saccharibacteria bacterium]
MNARRFVTKRSEDAPYVRRHKPDYQIVLYMGLLMLLGLVVMYAIGPQRANVLNNVFGTDNYDSMYFFMKQILSLGIAVGVFLIVTLVIPFRLFLRYSGKIVMIGFIASALLLLFGNILHVNEIAQCSLGACRWFNIGPFGLQPAELLKFGVLIFSAGFLGTRAKQGLINDWSRTLAPMSLLVGSALVAIVVIQKDMGTGITLGAMVATMLFIAGLSYRFGFALLGVSLAIGTLFIISAPHRMERVLTYFNGDNHSVDVAGDYHIAHAKMAIGSGGLFGVGIGNSIEATGYLPEAVNDSVFAIMGETFGFVGLIAILAIFTGLLLRLLRISDNLVDMRERIVVGGVFGWLAAHVILNIGAMTGLVPLTGITLPLLSFGGTSMVFIAAALGLAFQLSRYTVFGSKIKDDEYENSQRRRGVGRPRYSSRRRSA